MRTAGNNKLKNNNSNITPEDKLLIFCARIHVEPKIRENIKELLQKRLNWEYLIRKACLHRMRPLLFSNLKNVSPDKIPRKYFDHLKSHYVATAQRNLWMVSELLRLLKLLQLNGITGIPYKGPLLTASVYTHIALREFTDLDILIPFQDIQNAREILLEHGYPPRDHPEKSREAAYMRSQKDYKFLRDDGKFSRISVELHWRLALPYLSFPLDPEPLWQRAEWMPLFGMRVLNLSPEDLLLILCANGSKERWVRLSLICDIAEFLRTNKTLNWSFVFELAKHSRSQRMLLLGLYLAYDVLGARLPNDILHQAQSDLVVQSLASQVQKWFFDGTDSPHWGIEKSIFRLRMREDLRDRMPAFFHTLKETITVTEKEKQPLQLPESLTFLYYPLRIFRLMKKTVYSGSVRNHS